MNYKDLAENFRKDGYLVIEDFFEPWYSLYAMCMFSKDGTIGQAWHVDCPPQDPAVFNLNRLVYTEDILPEFGGEIVVVPGSHRCGHLSVGPVDVTDIAVYRNIVYQFSTGKILKDRLA